MNPTTNGTYEEFPLGHATRILVLDYFDGPTEGVVRFDSGDEYQFLQTTRESSLATPSRQYFFRALPSDALDRIVGVLEQHKSPNWPVWFPIWKFDSPEIEESISASIDAILEEAGPIEWQVTTSSPAFETYRLKSHSSRLAPLGS